MALGEACEVKERAGDLDWEGEVEMESVSRALALGSGDFEGSCEAAALAEGVAAPGGEGVLLTRAEPLPGAPLTVPPPPPPPLLHVGEGVPLIVPTGKEGVAAADAEDCAESVAPSENEGCIPVALSDKLGVGADAVGLELTAALPVASSDEAALTVVQAVGLALAEDCSDAEDKGEREKRVVTEPVATALAVTNEVAELSAEALSEADARGD